MVSKYPEVSDWANKAKIIEIFPAYRRQQLQMDADGIARSKLIELRGFSLDNPIGTAPIFVKTNLMIESNKRCAVYGPNGSGKTCLFEAISSHKVSGFPTYVI